MNHNETVDFVQQFSRFQPAFAKWQAEESRNLAGRGGTTPTDEARAMMASMSRTLANVTTDESAGALAAMEEGRLPIPPYGTLALVVRGFAADDRAGRKKAASYDRDRQQRYDCAACRDTGVVEVIAPQFVEWFRSQFEAYQNEKFPQFWHGAAYHDWRVQENGPMLHSALCNCTCQRTATLRSELEIFRRGERRIKGEALGPPACGLAIYDPRTMPLARGNAVLKETLADWYAKHEVNASHEWEPTESEYDARFK